MKGAEDGGRKPGTPNKATVSLQRLAWQFTDQALALVVAAMNNDANPIAIRLAAAKEIRPGDQPRQVGRRVAGLGEQRDEAASLWR